MPRTSKRKSVAEASPKRMPRASKRKLVDVAKSEEPIKKIPPPTTTPKKLPLKRIPKKQPNTVTSPISTPATTELQLQKTSIGKQEHLECLLHECILALTS